MRAALINPFLHSITKVLATMAMTDARPGTPQIKEDDISWGDVTGIIALSSKDTIGSFAISFPKSVILDITQKMLGERLEDIDDTVVDLVGELTNMMSGGAKRLFAEVGIDFDLTVPSILSGENHKVAHQAVGPKIIMPFATETGEFYVEVCFEEEPQKEH